MTTRQRIRVVIMATHPVQYYVPWYKELAACDELEVLVYYALIPDDEQQGRGFGVSFAWDIPLLDGYAWEVLPNTANYPGLKGYFASRTPGVTAALRRDRPDAVIITGWHSFPLLQCLLSCIRMGIPRIVRGDSNAMRTRTWWQRSMHRLLLHRFNAFLAVGESNRLFFLQNGISPDKIFKCRHCVDNHRFETQCAELRGQREQLRNFWGVNNSSACCFLFVGKLIPVKRIMDLLEAFRLVCAKGIPAHLLIVGTGELMDTARHFIEEHGLPVTFAGFLNQSEVPRAYVAADCLVLPSNYETWGLVVNEAMACELPAIVSDRVGCWPDLVHEGSTGAVFPYGDRVVLADKMAGIATDHRTRAAMGRLAADQIQAYSISAAVAGTLQALRSVTAKSS